MIIRPAGGIEAGRKEQIMTINERIKKALKGVDMDQDSVDKLIALAYYKGREDAAKEVCNKTRYLIAEQRKRAAGTRYHRLAASVIGDKDFVYSGDYAGDMQDMFGNDKTEL